MLIIVRCSYLKALYENMLVELPFAGFFLSKLLGTSADVDIHHLASLDPEVYKNLLFLKSYEGDVEELGLNFTVVNNDLGEAQVRSTSLSRLFLTPSFYSQGDEAEDSHTHVFLSV